ncbi:MFS transporter [Allocoprobacillus halotolerans]|uniref:MFS transporter n=1 Tax=Allocoprobacillus halotolerans TaxID=2944914 RepID=A0ABY5I755_9FIRM|nr:MFS transporter [Allocoprobacillus halotolerans]UTY40548.1 MFS transporter [Allocoprobacillus halotolerans]
MNKTRMLDVKYALTQVLYFASFSALMGYASVYLLAQNVSNSLIGTTLALVSIIAVFTQPMVASAVDKKVIKLQTLVNMILIATVILSLCLYFFKMPTMMLLCVFVGIVTFMMTIQPLLNSMAFLFEKYGIQINYGLARGLGSAAYALASAVLGYLVEDFGTGVIPLFYIIGNILLILVVYTYVVPKTQQNLVEVEQEVEETEQKQLSFFQFCAIYKKFMIFVVGVVLVFFTHTIINNFFIQVITPIGGTESQMGIAVFIAAIVELPAMAMFNVMRKKIDCSTLLKLSVVMFALKHFITFLATNIFMIYVAQVLQIGAYAIFIPASVYYVNEVISKQDLVKGQSMVTVGITASGIIANFAGGILLDAVGVYDLLMIGVIVSVVGGLIVFWSIGKKKTTVS